ncbi:MAG: hypothetical protein IJ341_12845 [Bacteroidales bacterium]|nr:hypothetical protein [Bacteroidales bacterium]
MFEPIKAPLSQAEALTKLNHYVSIVPVKIKRTFFGTKVYLYEDGTKIALFGDIQCNIWDPMTRKWGYTSRETAKQFATKLNRTQI